MGRRMSRDMLPNIPHTIILIPIYGWWIWRRRIKRGSVGGSIWNGDVQDDREFVGFREWRKASLNVERRRFMAEAAHCLPSRLQLFPPQCQYSPQPQPLTLIKLLFYFLFSNFPFSICSLTLVHSPNFSFLLQFPSFLYFTYLTLFIHLYQPTSLFLS